jgi:O-antigen/teichoic acid export membrane protein
MSSSRILFNTLVMYIKTVINIIVGLFTTRYVLEALGVDDFGIFGLVGSVIGVLEFINSTMAGATQRFLSYHRKQGNLNSVFTASIILHFIIGIVVIILLETGGFLFLDKLNIQAGRMAMVHFVFHCVAITTFFSIIATPYQALIKANEDMSFVATVSIIETLAKLGIALFLFSTPYDRLGTYAIAIMILAILMRIVQSVFCKIRYTNVTFSHQSLDRVLVRQMLAFSGWNFFENICYILRVNGLPIFVNLFFGTAINAISNLANQVSSQISTFSGALSQASAPQIASGIAGKDLERSKMLAVSSSKFQLFLVSLLGVPLLLNINYVLQIWLKKVPEDLPIFCCLAVMNEIMLNLSRGLRNLIDGRGFIRGFKITMGFSHFIVLPVAYIFLKMGYPPYSIYVALLALPVFANISCIYFAHRHVALSVPHFLKEMSKVLAAVLAAFLCTWLATSQLALSCHPLATLIISTSISSALMLAGFWLALDAKEHGFARGLLEKARRK